MLDYAGGSCPNRHEGLKNYVYIWSLDENIYYSRCTQCVQERLKVSARAAGLFM